MASISVTTLPKMAVSCLQLPTHVGFNAAGSLSILASSTLRYLRFKLQTCLSAGLLCFMSVSCHVRDTKYSKLATVADLSFSRKVGMKNQLSYTGDTSESELKMSSKTEARETREYWRTSCWRFCRLKKCPCRQFHEVDDCLCAMEVDLEICFFYSFNLKVEIVFTYRMIQLTSEKFTNVMQCTKS